MGLVLVVEWFSMVTCDSLGGNLGGTVSNITQISHVLFTSLLLPFEVTSILILVAILGAVVLARKEQ